MKLPAARRHPPAPRNPLNPDCAGRPGRRPTETPGPSPPPPRLDKISLWIPGSSQRSARSSTQQLLPGGGALGVTQPAVSLQIRALEERLGRDCSIAPAGASSRPRRAPPLRSAQRLLRAEQQLLDDLAAGEPDDLRGRLALGASTGPGGRLVPLLLCEFARAAPAAFGCALDLRHADVIDQGRCARAGVGVVGAATRTRASCSSRSSGTRSCSRSARHDFAGQDSRARGAGGRGAGRDAGGRGRPPGGRGGATPRRGPVAAALEDRAGLQESVKSAVAAGHGVAFISRTALEDELAAGSPPPRQSKESNLPGRSGSSAPPAGFRHVPRRRSSSSTRQVRYKQYWKKDRSMQSEP